jgi:chaperonin GroES
MNVQPFNTWVLVKKLDTQQVSSGGLMIAEADHKLPIIGTVVKLPVGTPENDDAAVLSQLNVDDVVLFYTGHGQPVDGSEDLVLVKANEILARVDSD